MDPGRKTRRAEEATRDGSEEVGLVGLERFRSGKEGPDDLGK